MRKGKCNKTGDNTTKLCGPGTHTHTKKNTKENNQNYTANRKTIVLETFPKVALNTFQSAKPWRKKKKKKMNETTVGGHKT